MASKSADNTYLNSDHESDRESDHTSFVESDDQNDDQEELFDDDAAQNEEPEAAPELADASLAEDGLAETEGDEPLHAPPAIEEPAVEEPAIEENDANPGDEELLEMLEQLSETIDTAHNVLAEQHVQSSEEVPAEQDIELDEQFSGLEERASGLAFPPPPPLPGTPVVKKAIVPVLVTAFSIFFGIAALAVMWLFWNSPENPGKINLAKDQDRFSGTAVSRALESDEISPAPVSVPAKTTALVSVPAKTPAPVAATEPVATPDPVTPPEPAVKTAEIAKPAIVVTKETPVRRVKTTALFAPSTPAAPAAPAAPAIERTKIEPGLPAQTPAPVKPAPEVIKEEAVVAAVAVEPAVAAVPVEKVPAPPSISKAEAAPLLKRGHDLIISGDVASARLAYEYAAHRGSADAMYALAQTYDIEVLASWDVVGIEPDIKMALEWYGRAAQNGHDPADARASELEKLSKR